MLDDCILYCLNARNIDSYCSLILSSIEMTVLQLMPSFCV